MEKTHATSPLTARNGEFDKFIVFAVTSCLNYGALFSAGELYIISKALSTQPDDALEMLKATLSLPLDLSPAEELSVLQQAALLMTRDEFVQNFPGKALTSYTTTRRSQKAKRNLEDLDESGYQHSLEQTALRIDHARQAANITTKPSVSKSISLEPLQKRERSNENKYPNIYTDNDETVLAFCLRYPQLFPEDIARWKNTSKGYATAALVKARRELRGQQASSKETDVKTDTSTRRKGTQTKTALPPDPTTTPITAVVLDALFGGFQLDHPQRASGGQTLDPSDVEALREILQPRELPEPLKSKLPDLPSPKPKGESVTDVEALRRLIGDNHTIILRLAEE